MTRPDGPIPPLALGVAGSLLVAGLDLAGVSLAYVLHVAIAAPSARAREGRPIAVALLGTGLILAATVASPSGDLGGRLVVIAALWVVVHLVRPEPQEEAEGAATSRQRIHEVEREQAALEETSENRVQRLRTVLSVMQDLEREQVKLRTQVQENARIVAMLEASRDAIFSETPDGVVTSWNRAAEALYGYSAREMIGKSATCLIPSADLDESWSANERVLAGQDVAVRYAERRRKDGSLVEVSLAVSPIDDVDGQIVGLSTIARDVTEKRRNDRLVALAVEASSSGMLMVDGAGKIVMVNSMVEEIFGYSRDELIGQRLELLIPERLRDDHGGYFAGYLESPSARPMGEGRSLVGLARSGREVRVEIGLTPVETQAGIHVLASVVDISEREKIIGRLRGKTEELERLLYVVSHDLRSPLVTVSGFAGLLQKYVANGDLEKAEQAAQRVVRGTQIASRLIDDLLELSRLGSGKFGSDSVPLRAVIDEVEASLEGALTAAQATVVVEADLPSVRGDRGYVTHVFLNLIENAIKYGCPEPGAEIRVGSERRDDVDVIYVADRGPGIPEDQRGRVFDLFHRLSNDDAGTGVGLAAVAKIMERLGGSVWVENNTGGGSKLCLAFVEWSPPAASETANLSGQTP